MAYRVHKMELNKLFRGRTKGFVDHTIKYLWVQTAGYLVRKAVGDAIGHLEKVQTIFGEHTIWHIGGAQKGICRSFNKSF